MKNPFRSKSKKNLDKMQFSQFVSWIGNLFNRSKKDYSKMLVDPTGSSVIMAVILWILRRWPEAPIYLDKDGDPVEKSPFLDILKKPNPFYGQGNLWWGTIFSLLWDGNGYWIKIKDGQLRIRELWYVPHFMMNPRTNRTGANFIDYYEYNVDGKIIRIELSDVVHFRYGIDPYNIRKGMSPLKSIIRDAVTDEEADNFAASLLINMGVPGLAITPDLSSGTTPPSDIDVADMKKYLNDNFTGDHRGKPFVSRGPIKIQQFGFDPKSMALDAIRSIPEERVCAVTGVPAAVVGFGTGMNQTKVGSTLASLREMAYEDAIIPMQRIVAPELENQMLPDLVPNPDELKVKFDLSEVRVLQEDQDQLHKRIGEDFNNGIAFLDEARAKLGYADEGLHVRRVPFAVTETESVVETIEPDFSDQKSIGLKSIDKRGKLFIDFLAKAHEKRVKKYTDVLMNSMETIGRKVADAFLVLADSGAVELTQIKGRKAGIEDHHDSLSIEAHKILVEASKQGGLEDDLVWQAQYIEAGKDVVNGMNIVYGAGLELSDPVMQEILKDGGKHIKFINIDTQTQEAIIKALYEGRKNGQGARAIAREIRTMAQGKSMYPGVYQRAFDAAKARGWGDEAADRAGDRAARQYRSEVISRTESKYAQNKSVVKVAKNSGTFNALQVSDGIYGSPRSGEIDIASNGQIISLANGDVVVDDEHISGTMSLLPTIVDPSQIEEPLLGRGG